MEQFEQINELTSEQNHINRIGLQEFNRLFKGESTCYFNTNEEILKHNLKMLARLESPVCRINSKHNRPEASKGNEEQAMKLPTTVYLSVGSKVLLNWNLSTRHKLVNGSTGIIRDIIFAPNQLPPDNLPVTIIVEFPSYQGPAFFADIFDETGNIIENRSKWVPLKPETASWQKNTRQGSKSLERTAFPISLAWAWTPWKGQGTTNHGYCCMFPGIKEKSLGLCYVMLSRITTLFHLCIPEGLSFERLTTIISSHKGLQSRRAKT